MDKKMLNCIVCPLGCEIELFLENNEISKIQGNNCIRGISYALSEFTFPERTLTTTVRTSSIIHPLLPVRSQKPLPKNKLMDCMKVIEGIKVTSSVKCGDVIIEDILNTGVNIIAAKKISI